MYASCFLTPSSYNVPTVYVEWIHADIAHLNNYRVLFAVSGPFRFRNLALFVWQETSGGWAATLFCWSSCLAALSARPLAVHHLPAQDVCFFMCYLTFRGTTDYIGLPYRSTSDSWVTIASITSVYSPLGSWRHAPCRCLAATGVLWSCLSPASLLTYEVLLQNLPQFLVMHLWNYISQCVWAMCQRVRLCPFWWTYYIFTTFHPSEIPVQSHCTIKKRRKSAWQSTSADRYYRVRRI